MHNWPKFSLLLRVRRLMSLCKGMFWPEDRSLSVFEDLSLLCWSFTWWRKAGRCLGSEAKLQLGLWGQSHRVPSGSGDAPGTAGERVMCCSFWLPRSQSSISGLTGICRGLRGCFLLFLRYCRAWEILEVPDVRRQGTEYGRNQVGWHVEMLKLRLQWGVWVTHLLLRGCGIPLFSFCLCRRRAALPVTGQGPRAMPPVPAALGYLGWVSAWRAASSWVGPHGQGWRVLCTGVAVLSVDSAPCRESSTSCSESQVPSWVPPRAEIHVRTTGHLEPILHLLDTSESCWLENKARIHYLKSCSVLKETCDWCFQLRTELLTFRVKCMAWRFFWKKVFSMWDKLI